MPMTINECMKCGIKYVYMPEKNIHSKMHHLFCKKCEISEIKNDIAARGDGGEDDDLSISTLSTSPPPDDMNVDDSTPPKFNIESRDIYTSNAVIDSVIDSLLNNASDARNTLNHMRNRDSKNKGTSSPNSNAASSSGTKTPIFGTINPIFTTNPHGTNTTTNTSPPATNTSSFFIPNIPHPYTPSNHPNMSSLTRFISIVLGGDKTTLNECCDLSPPTKRNKGPTSPQPLCPDVSLFPFKPICIDIANINDLIKLGKEYSPTLQIQTTIDLYKVSKLVTPLEELNNMIGLDTLKQSIFDEILPILQGLDDKNKDWYHSVIKGPPGVGKTKLCGILAKIYKSLGILPTDKVHSIKPDDLVAGYVGQTAIKTRKQLEAAIGGVLLIDEAYSFGDSEQRDSFKKEAIDMLTSFLSERGHEFVCIIAGYKDALEQRFFSMNEGLARRFRIHYEIKAYEAHEMNLIYQKICRDGGWNIDENTNFTAFFREHIAQFPHFGGDCMNLFTFAKKAHSKRLMSITTKSELDSTKKKLNLADVTNGFELYCERNGYGQIKHTGGFMYS